MGNARNITLLKVNYLENLWWVPDRRISPKYKCYLRLHIIDNFDNNRISCFDMYLLKFYWVVCHGLMCYTLPLLVCNIYRQSGRRLGLYLYQKQGSLSTDRRLVFSKRYCLNLYNVSALLSYNSSDEHSIS